MKNTKVRALTDTAVASAICALLIIILTFVPPLSFVVALFASTPIMYVTLKWKWQYGTIGTLCAFLVSFVLIGDGLSVALAMLTYILPGLIFGVCVSKGVKFLPAVAVSSISAIVALVLELMILNGGGDGIENMMSEIIGSMGETVEATLSQMGAMAEADISYFVAELISQTLNMFMRYIPSIVLGGAFVYSYIIAMLGSFILKRLRVKNVEYTSFSMLYASRSMCVITVVLFALCNIDLLTGVYLAAIENMLLLSIMALAVCGLSSVDFRLKRRVRPWFIRAIIYLGVFLLGGVFSSMIMTVLIFTGFIDGILGVRNPQNTGDDGYEKK